MRAFHLLLTFLLFSCFQADDVLAQHRDVSEPIARQIIIMFESDVVDVSTTAGAVGVANAAMPVAVKSLLLQKSAREISRAFPHFTSADTTRLLPNGELYKVPNRSNVFVVTVAPGTDRVELITRLEQLPQVKYA